MGTFRSDAWLSRRVFFVRLGAEVRETIYPGMGHTINDDEIARVRGLMARLIERDHA